MLYVILDLNVIRLIVIKYLILQFELLGLLVEGALAQVKLKHITNTTTTAMNETDDNWTTTPITPHDSVINTNTI